MKDTTSRNTSTLSIGEASEGVTASEGIGCDVANSAGVVAVALSVEVVTVPPLHMSVLSLLSSALDRSNSFRFIVPVWLFGWMFDRLFVRVFYSLVAAKCMKWKL
jgi:hypothetical protein